MSRKWASTVQLALRSRQGAALIEYALLAGLVALVAVASVTNFGTTVQGKIAMIAAAT